MAVPCTVSTFLPPSYVPRSRSGGWCSAYRGLGAGYRDQCRPLSSAEHYQHPCLVTSACWLTADRSAQGEVTICLAQCWQWQQTAVARSPRNKWLRPGVWSLGPGGTLVQYLYSVCTVSVHSPVRTSNHRHFKTHENCTQLWSSRRSFAFNHPPSSLVFDWSVTHEEVWRAASDFSLILQKYTV